MTISALDIIGFAGDPQNQQAHDINAALVEANTDIAAAVTTAATAAGVLDAAQTTAIIAALAALTVRGVATIINTATTVVVTHNLATTPLPGDIVVCPIEAWGSALQFLVHTLTATEFTIEVDQDPTQDVDFAWQFQQVD